jgi:hypothetical protein
MSDTPETDALYMDDHRPNLMDHARRLERERDQAQSIVKALSDKCGEFKSERDKARDILDKMLLNIHSNKTMRHIQSLQFQRDQLREINAELFAAVEMALDDWQDGVESHQADSYDVAREVLTKAKAVKL